MFRLSLFVVATLVAGAASGQTVLDECGWMANPANIPEPWPDYTWTYANGAIRIALLDTSGEPVCCPTHLLILSPSAAEEGLAYRQCHVVSDTADGRGFSDIDFEGITASYDAARGLQLAVPFWRYTDGRDQGMPGSFSVWINQSSGTVTLDQQLK
jgi:hypothetical protein